MANNALYLEENIELQMEILREISFVLNVTVVILGSILKLPQIVELYKNKSSKGISIWGNFLDLIW